MEGFSVGFCFVLFCVFFEVTELHKKLIIARGAWGLVGMLCCVGEQAASSCLAWPAQRCERLFISLAIGNNPSLVFLEKPTPCLGKAARTGDQH